MRRAATRKQEIGRIVRAFSIISPSIGLVSYASMHFVKGRFPAMLRVPTASYMLSIVTSQDSRGKPGDEDRRARCGQEAVFQ